MCLVIAYVMIMSEFVSACLSQAIVPFFIDEAKASPGLRPGGVAPIGAPHQ